MGTELLKGEDIRFLAQQPDSEVGVMLGQMTTLMQNITDIQNDTDDKVAKIESQGWFKRMTSTLLGKNKATKQEIQKNNDKVVTYISQSVAQLYQMNMINERMICSLGNRMNEVYMQVTGMYQDQLNMKAQISEMMAIQQQTLETMGAFASKLNDKIERVDREQQNMKAQISDMMIVQRETIESMGAFVGKLNEKIESVDNFHMLISEIQNGMYNDPSILYNICSILAQLDKRQMDDSRKMTLLRDTMERAGIVTGKEFTVLQCLQEIIALPNDKIGLIYMELCNFRQSFPANLFADMIENYHFLSKMERMSKKKEVIIQRVMDKYELDADAAFSVSDITDSFFENKQAFLVGFSGVLQIPVSNENSGSELNDSEMNASDNENSDSELNDSDTDSDFDLERIHELWDEEREKEAFDILVHYAERGNIEAQEYLGLSYDLGLGVDEDVSEAFKWYLKAAEHGNITCMGYVADLYAGRRKGSEHLRNAKKAEEWYKKAEASGECYKGYYEFLVHEGRVKEAFSVMKRGAEAGDTSSMCDLANIYYWGEDNSFGIPNVSQDLDKAGKWYEKAAEGDDEEEGDPIAMMHMGEFYLYGLGGFMEDDDKAFRYLMKAVDEDDDLPAAHFLLGNCYNYGYGTNKNKSKAKVNYQKAADNDHVEAMFELGLIYSDEGDSKEAYKWMRKAADNDYAKAQLELGIWYDEGTNISQDYRKANEWFDKSMKNGNVDAKAWLGSNYCVGKGVREDFDYGIELIEEAAEEGSEFANDFLEGSYED